MIKRFLVIIFLLSGYIYLVSSDPEGNLVHKIKKLYGYYSGKYKDMDLKYHVNKWPETKKKRYY